MTRRDLGDKRNRVNEAAQLVRSLIQDVPDFPKPGIVFKDLTPVFAHPEALRSICALFEARYRNHHLTQVVAVESRGFLLGAPLAMSMGLPLQLVRKHGKLPRATRRAEYSKEYGVDIMELHRDAVSEGDRVVLIDDLLATGGTARAAKDLVEAAGAEVVETAFLVELTFLEGRQVLGGDVFALVGY